MTITRIWQAGAELQHINELQLGGHGNGSPTISSTKAKTGTYSFRNTGFSETMSAGRTVATSQIRAGVFLNYNTVNISSSSNYVYLLVCTGTYQISVRWSQASNLELVVNGTVRASGSVASLIPNPDTWYHLGLTLKANASTGFVSFYVDGTQKLTWSGDTGSSLTGVYFGGSSNASFATATLHYYDDFYVDDAVGEADAAPPSPRFSFLLPNGAGNYTNWNVNTGSNYAAVDDSGAPDDETTYVYATSSGVQDSYALTNTTAGVTVPAGYAIDAVIPIAWAKKTDAGTASTLKLGTRLSSTNNIGSAQTLATSFGPVWDRQTSDPGAGAWSEADIDALEVVIESAGAY